MRRDLAGRAALIAAGVGTALGAGAGLANAAPLEHDLQQDQAGNNAFDQSQATGALPTDALAGGGLAQAPNLPLTGALPTKTQAASPLDMASADQLAALGGVLGGAGEKAEQGGASEEAATDEASGTTDQASGTSDQATESTESASPNASGSGSTEGSGSTSSPSGSSDDASGDYTATYGS